jgi:hypothetical protein
MDRSDSVAVLMARGKNSETSPIGMRDTAFRHEAQNECVKNQTNGH